MPDSETCEDRGYDCCETLEPHVHLERYGYLSAGCKPIEALAGAARAAQTQLILIATVNGMRAIKKGEVEHAMTLRQLEAALKECESELTEVH